MSVRITILCDNYMGCFDSKVIWRRIMDVFMLLGDDVMNKIKSVAALDNSE